MWMWSRWHGKVGELIRALGHEHWSISIVMCPVMQAELPPKHLNPSAAFIGGLLSLLVHGLIAFYFSLLVWLQHFIEFMSRFTSTTMSDIHAGGKITRQRFNQQPFLCHLRDLSICHIDWNFQTSDKNQLNQTRPFCLLCMLMFCREMLQEGSNSFYKLLFICSRAVTFTSNIYRKQHWFDLILRFYLKVTLGSKWVLRQKRLIQSSFKYINYLKTIHYMYTWL